MMMTDVEQHCRELERCNQRGGRMLSLLDLIERETVPLNVAAHLMATLAQGTSFLVGAQPGGAGKTTVMCALANLLPPAWRLIAATYQNIAMGAQTSAKKSPMAFICHEIGSGPYFAYLWGRELREYFELLAHGHILVTNLHADTLEETYSEICRINQVSEDRFNQMKLAVFIKVSGRYAATRRLSSIYFHCKDKGHILVYDDTDGIRNEWTNLLGKQRIDACESFLMRNLQEGIRTIRDTRERFLQWFIKESLLLTTT